MARLRSSLRVDALEPRSSSPTSLIRRRRRSSPRVALRPSPSRPRWRSPPIAVPSSSFSRPRSRRSWGAADRCRAPVLPSLEGRLLRERLGPYELSSVGVVEIVEAGGRSASRCSLPLVLGLDAFGSPSAGARELLALASLWPLELERALMTSVTNLTRLPGVGFSSLVPRPPMLLPCLCLSAVPWYRARPSMPSGTPARRSPSSLFRSCAVGDEGRRGEPSRLPWSSWFLAALLIAALLLGVEASFGVVVDVGEGDTTVAESSLLLLLLLLLLPPTRLFHFNRRVTLLAARRTASANAVGDRATP